MRFAEIITEGRPTSFWRMLKQVGVNEVVGVLPRGFFDWRRSTTDRPWDYVPLAIYKQMIEEEGLKLAGIEDNPPMDAIRYGGPERDEEIENVITLIKNMGKLGIPVWCYNWGGSMIWLRTSTRLRGRGGAIVSGFDSKVLENGPPPLQGTVDSETLWKNLKIFLERVVPVAEEAGVKLAMHPDDPPVLPSIRGVARIMNSVESFERLLDLYPSDVNGITLCQGNFALMTDDVPSVIRHLGSTGKIFFVHYRDVRGTASKFEETFIDDGKTDMVECMRAYRDIGFNGIMRCDHTPTLEGDNDEVAGYSIYGRLHAIGYMTGIRQSVLSEK